MALLWLGKPKNGRADVRQGCGVKGEARIQGAAAREGVCYRRAAGSARAYRAAGHRAGRQAARARAGRGSSACRARASARFSVRWRDAASSSAFLTAAPSSRGWTSEQAFNLYDVRAVLEGLCVRLATQNVPTETWQEFVDLFGAPMDELVKVSDFDALSRRATSASAAASSNARATPSRPRCSTASTRRPTSSSAASSSCRAARRLASREHRATVAAMRAGECGGGRAAEARQPARAPRNTCAASRSTCCDERRAGGRDQREGHRWAR